MEYYNRYLCVTVDELTRKEDGPAIMSMFNYKSLVNRNRINVIRKAGGMGVYALIDYNSLPERFRSLFEAKYGKPADIMKKADLADDLLEDSRARQYFNEYRRADGAHLTDDQINEYTRNASVLNELVKILNKREALRKSLGGRGGISVRQLVLNTAEKYGEHPGHTLPTSWVRLKEKIENYKAEGYESVISGRVGNCNAVKITPDAGRLIVALKRSRVPKYTTEQLFNEFNRQAALKGWKQIKSPNSITQYLERPEVKPLWYDARHGELAYKQLYQRKHKTELPKLPNVLWYGDGTKLNLYYKDYNQNGKKLIVCTTSVYEVMDAYSETLLGFHISPTENYEAQYRAFRMAITTANCKPYEVVTDGQGGHKKLESLEFFDRICRVSRRTAPYNPQSKTIESAFGRFQQQVLSRDWRFTGQNITAKKAESRPDMEFIEANVESLYTLSELMDAYQQYRTEWNMQPHPATGRPRYEMYRGTINPDAPELTLRDKVDMFWNETERPSTFTSSGITITVNKKEYTYEVFDQFGMPDLNFRELHTYRQFVVKYDPLDMTSIRLYIEEKQGLRFVATAYPYATVHRAIYDQLPGEQEFIRIMQDRQKQQRVQHQIAAAELEAAHGVAPEQHGLNRPRIKGLNAKSTETFMDNNINEKPKPEPISVGVHNKVVSNYTFDQAAAYDKM